jgi:hypothetical protein
MSRIIVVPDSAHPMLEGCLVLMDGRVQLKHLQDRRSPDQLIERVAWTARAAGDAEQYGANARTRRAIRRRQ